MERFTHKLAIAPDRLDLDHLRRHLGRHRADPGQHLHPQDPVGLLRGEEPLSGAAARREGPATPTAVWNSILEHEGSVQHLDCLSDDEKDVFKTAFETRPALGHRTGRRPHAGDLPAPVGQPLPARRRRQVGPAHAALDGVGARLQVALLPALQVGAARRLRRRRGSGERSTCEAPPRPTTRNAWPASRGLGGLTTETPAGRRGFLFLAFSHGEKEGPAGGAADGGRLRGCALAATPHPLTLPSLRDGPLPLPLGEGFV